jgi:hypothetical protein
MRTASIVLALGILAFTGFQAWADTPHTATVRAKSLEEAKGPAADRCGELGKRAVFMYSEPDPQNAGMMIFYFACK